MADDRRTWLARLKRWTGLLKTRSVALAGPQRRRWVALAGLAVVLGATFALGGLTAVGLIEFGVAGRIMAALRAPAEEPQGDAEEVAWRRLETALSTVEIADIPLGDVDGQGQGGAIVELGRAVIVMTTRGRIGVVDLDGGRIGYLDERVPMGVDALMATEAWDDARFNRAHFRVIDMVAAPTGPESASLYVSHHQYEEGPSRRICIVVDRVGVALKDGGPVLDGDWTEVYRSTPCVDLEATGSAFDEVSCARMQFVSDHEMLLALGESGAGEDLTNPAADRMKVLRLDTSTGETELIARGLRNPCGLLVDAEGRIWTTDNGPQGGDEINLIRPGADYGWPFVSYGTGYGVGLSARTPLPTNPVQGRHDGYEPPVWAFLPSVSPTQLVQITGVGDAFPLWEGDLIAGSLRGLSLFRFRVENDRPVYAEQIDLQHRIRDVIVLTDGRLAMLTDERTLLLLRDPEVHRKDEADGAFVLAGYDDVRTIEAAVSADDREFWARETFRGYCGSCHSMIGAPSVGPPLDGLVGRRIASVEGYPYSLALSEQSGRWTRSRIAAFVRDPASAGFDGTAMPPLPWLDDDELDAIMDYASSLSRSDGSGSTSQAAYAVPE